MFHALASSDGCHGSALLYTMTRTQVGLSRDSSWVFGPRDQISTNDHLDLKTEQVTLEGDTRSARATGQTVRIKGEA